MSNKSGVAGQVISLPSGGGALTGIGETFSPHLFTGTGTITVPIVVPPGRNGFQPKLDLGYSTGAGNGAFGLGWELSVPEVTRKTSRGVPRYRDDAPDPGEHDTFILSGSEDLVPVARPASGVTRFRPRTEGAFARIEHVRDGGDFWRVSSRDGLVSRYGTAGSDDGVIADPGQARKVFRWRLTETTDPFGNRIEYDYLRDRGADGPRSWDQLYLQRIRYADYDHDGQTRFLVSVAFIYSPRPDPFSDHRAGFEVRTRLRCTRIEVRTHPVDGDRLVRTYHLVYADERAGELDPAVLPRNGVSLLSQIRVVGHDGTRTEQAPPLEFGYSGFEPEAQRPRPVEGAGNALPRSSLAHEDVELVDLFGNGLPDIVALNGTAQFWRNLGGGRFDAPRAMAEVPTGVRLGDPGTQLADLNGNGRADLLALAQGGYFPLSFAGRWSGQGFVRYRATPSVPFGDGNLRLVDLDGDGVVDALRTGSSFELYFNDPTDGWAGVQTRPRRPPAEFPDVAFSDPQVKLADLSGDGLQDIVLVEQGRVRYWPYLGHGRWGPRVTMAASPVFRDPALPPGRFDPRRVLFGDLDGDGLDDLVYVEPDRVTIWINRSGNEWSQPVTIEGTPRFADADAVRVVDLRGTGTAGLLWTDDSPGPATGSYQFAELAGGSKPYLLVEMDNHHGARTRVRYASSTESYLADASDPDRRWRTPLPFPVQVVAAVEVIDEISGGKLTSEFRYHHGYWDGAEREFRGFGMVEQLDTERFESFNAPSQHGPDAEFNRVERDRFAPPLLTRTWFHLGPVGEESGGRAEADLTREYWPDDRPVLERPPATRDLLGSLPASHRADALRSLRGSVVRTELYTLDASEREGRPFTVTEAQYGIREEDPPAPGDPARRRIFFPHPVAARTTQWERGTDPMHQFVFTDGYDRYGMPGRQTALAVPRGRDFRRAGPAGAEPYLGTRTETGYAQRDDEHRYLVDRVARTTTHEIRNDGRPSLFELLDSVHRGTASLAVIGQVLNYYDGNAFDGLPLGRVGDFGALVRTRTLVLTEEILDRAHRDGDQLVVPPYVAPGPAPGWTGEYPEQFRDQMPPLAGYIRSPGDPDSEPGYFVATIRQRYDFHGRPARAYGLPAVTRDPLGRDTTIAYDRFGVLPVEVVDPVGLRTRAAHDYRVLQPRMVTDPNGNRTAFSFTPLGLLAGAAIMGKEGERAGDTPQAPSTRLVYDLTAFAQSPPGRRRPISVRTIRRVRHMNDTGVAAAEPDETIETVEYSDGFDRLVQTRSQAEDLLFGDPTFGGDVLGGTQDDPADRREVTGTHNGDRERPNVVVSGWQVYDNKGRVVERYEPFRATGWDYDPPADAQLGQRVRLTYDPRGQVVRSVHPDGSLRRVVYGVPTDLADPERFTPTPWEVFTYDANDNAGRTHSGEAGPYAHHWNTPASVAIDALGREALSVERHRSPRADHDDATAPIAELVTRSTRDIRGNLLRLTDALGREAFRYVYDLADRPLRTEGIDVGDRRTVFDATGNAVEHRDGKGSLVLRSYDALDRPVRVWARDDGTGGVTLRERLEYGDGGDPDQPTAERAAARVANRLGALHRHYDEAGLLTLDRYDFKHNPLVESRQVISDDAILAGYPATFRTDWQPPEGTTAQAHAAGLLEARAYETSTSYDALNRVVSARFPAGGDGERRKLRTGYSRAGLLERVSLDGQPVVEHVAHDAGGRRTLVALGNGVLVRYAYEPRTFRLRRMRAERYTKPQARTYQPAGPAWQEYGYRYDLAGNLLEIVERRPGSGVRGNPDAGAVADPELRSLLASGDALLRRFDYDPLYRLTSATGRECTDAAGQPPWQDGQRCGFNTPTDINAADLARPYQETYAHDAVGNLTRLRRTAGNATTTRQFTLVSGTNRLRTMTVGQSTVPYRYDRNGNLTGETDSRHLDWDHGDRLVAFRVQAGEAPASVHAQYLYDASGQRVKRLTRKQGGGVEAVTWINEVFEHHRWPGGENYQIHVMDDQQRVAMVRVGPAHPDDAGPAVRYHLGDHLGSSNVVVDSGGDFVNREEYTPFGESSFGSFARKRYRFTGKERDEESSLSYHGARYYSPWLARWTGCDPMGAAEGVNAYVYAGNGPLRYVDADGAQRASVADKEGSVVQTTAVGDLVWSQCLEYDPRPDFSWLLRTRSDQAKVMPPNLEGARPLTSVEEQIGRGEYVDQKEGFFRQQRELRALEKQAAELADQARALRAALRREPLVTGEMLREHTQAERAGLAVIYLRADLRTGRLYVGRTTGDELGRFLTRQAEHQGKLGRLFEWRILQRVETSRAGATEESWIRRFGGPSRYGGHLQNWRYEMNNEEYERQMRSTGQRPVPRPTPNRVPRPSRRGTAGRVPTLPRRGR